MGMSLFFAARLLWSGPTQAAVLPQAGKNEQFIGTLSVGSWADPGHVVGDLQYGDCWGNQSGWGSNA